MALLEENKWDEKLPDLPAHQKYKELDKPNILNDGITYCNTMENSDDWDKSFCNKVSKHLKELSSEKGSNLKEKCYYFRHWFHHHIRKKYYNGNDVKNKSISGKLFDLVALLIKDYPSLEPCGCYESGTPEMWKEEKDVHDYFKNFEYIKSNKCDKKSCETYLNYINYINTIYRSIYDKDYGCCYYDTMETYCEPYFSCDEQYDPNNILLVLKSTHEKLKTEEGKVLTPIKIPKTEAPLVTDHKVITPPQHKEIAQDVSIMPSNLSDETIDVSSNVILSAYNTTNQNYLHNFIVVISILGAITFLYYYHSSTSQGSTVHKMRIKKKELPKGQNEILKDESPSHESVYQLLDYYIGKSYLVYHPTENYSYSYGLIRNGLGEIYEDKYYYI
ncbi:variable surface protein [Plasmodium gonderi]|uniref:Variable surface protein n=1 Tax=Plasmodium gonderi TaxID=77519 RepID=A0A1Y1JMA4_PLAGO|nr:variable surface protein [Plasmodium gonderi]GAW82728.1 variable surface protein [Plasmodium gonderi]